MTINNESTSCFTKNLIERVSRGYGKHVTSFLWMPFKHERKQPTRNILRHDVMPIREMKKSNCIPEKKYPTLTN